jgi:hypothetical protein
MREHENMPDYYEVLGVAFSATPDEIRKAWRKLAVEYHPDKLAGASAGVRKLAEEKLKEINAAYDVLSDQEKRRGYDEQRAERKREQSEKEVRANKEAKYAHIRELYESGDIEGAVREAESLFESFPDDPHCQDNYAALLYEWAKHFAEKGNVAEATVKLNLAARHALDDKLKAQIRADLELLRSRSRTGGASRPPRSSPEPTFTSPPPPPPFTGTPPSPPSVWPRAAFATLFAKVYFGYLLPILTLGSAVLFALAFFEGPKQPPQGLVGLFIPVINWLALLGALFFMRGNSQPLLFLSLGFWVVTGVFLVCFFHSSELRDRCRRFCRDRIGVSGLKGIFVIAAILLVIATWRAFVSNQAVQPSRTEVDSFKSKSIPELLAESTNETLADMSDSDREYWMTFTPEPGSGELQPYVARGGLSSIRFVAFDPQQKTVKALVKQTGYWVTNSITLAGAIEGNRLIIHGNEPDSLLSFDIQSHYREITGRYRLGRHEGAVKVSFGNSYLLDADPKIADSLFWIQARGKDIFKAAVYTNQRYYLPATSPLRDDRYVYIPNMVVPMDKYPSDTRIFLFHKPSPSMQVIPIFSINQIVRKVPAIELERLLEEQTGKSAGELSQLDTDSKNRAMADGWQKFDRIVPTTPKLQQAVDFTLYDIKLGDNISNIKGKSPGFQPWLSTNNAELEGTWRITREQGLSEAKQIAFSLHGGRVTHMWLTYSIEDIEKMGGWQIVADRLKKNLGEPDTDSTGAVNKDGQSHVSFQWTVPECQRSFSFGYTSGEKGLASINASVTAFSATTRKVASSIK